MNQSERNRQSYEKKKSLGICLRCPELADGVTLHCPEHRIKRNEQGRVRGAIYKSKNREKLADKSKERYANNRERWYGYELMKNYNITLEQYKEMLLSQGGVCAICGGINKNGWRLCLDHSHITNLPRGILCRRCNSLLGLCEENVEILESMINYLEGYK